MRSGRLPRRFSSPSGGGYGDLLGREMAVALDDVANGLVSWMSAGNDYGIVIRQALIIDEGATNRLRKKMSREHKVSQD